MCTFKIKFLAIFTIKIHALNFLKLFSHLVIHRHYVSFSLLVVVLLNYLFILVVCVCQSVFTVSSFPASALLL